MPDLPSESPGSPGYGTTDRYLDESGRAYYEDFQAPLSALGAQFNRHIWAPFLRPEHHVLDFGCSDGALLRSFDLARRVGVEINPLPREIARENGIETYTQVSEVPGLFDRIISSHALEHVPYPQQALSELREKLRGPDSRLVLLLPLDDWRHRSQRHYRPDDINQHLHTWTPLNLGNLLAASGFRVESVDVITHAWSPRMAPLWSFSPALFHAASGAWSWLKLSRQLLAVAKLP